MTEWKDNAVSKNIEEPSAEWISDADRIDGEIKALKRTITQIAMDPANAKGESLVNATHFDSEQMRAIQKKLQDCLDWLSV